MLLLDVNVLLRAFREDVEDHVRYREWLEALVAGPGAFGVSDLVLSSFIRIATHARIFKTPTPTRKALEFARALRTAPNCVAAMPGPRHWEIFVELCERSGARGNLVPDAYLAALAIEVGGEWITTDRDFARFAGLRWRHPFD